MTDTEEVESSVQYPYIHIEQRPDPEDPANVQLALKAGAGIDSPDHIVTILLTLTEQLTGVSAGLYAREIELTRRIARGEPLFGTLFGTLGDSDLDEE